MSSADTCGKWKDKTPRRQRSNERMLTLGPSSGNVRVEFGQPFDAAK
jgi:hypothetical protein